LREDDLRLLLTSGRIQCLQAPRPRKLGRPDFRLGRRRPTLIHPLNCSTATAAAKRTCHSHIACIPEGLGVQQTEHSCPPFLVESEQPFLVFDETQVPGLTLPSSIDVASRPTVPPVHPSVTLARCQLSFWHVLGMIKSRAHPRRRFKATYMNLCGREISTRRLGCAASKVALSAETPNPHLPPHRALYSLSAKLQLARRISCCTTTSRVARAVQDPASIPKDTA